MAARVIVLGSGAAGLSAAVSAAQAGASVTVLESASSLGGTTAISGGGIWIPANPWGAAHGVEDSAQDALRYLKALELGDSDTTLAGCLGTKGGLRTDEHGRVLSVAGGEAIPGLYAAGNAAANLFGCGYPGPGATIGPAVVFGWFAGQAAAANG